MKLVIFYQPKTEYARLVEEFVHDFTRQHPELSPELLDVDSAPARARADVYDIVRYPTVLITSDDGQLIHMWSGELLPLQNEVLGYLRG